jgi:hypothetical protein
MNPTELAALIIEKANRHPNGTGLIACRRVSDQRYAQARLCILLQDHWSEWSHKRAWCKFKNGAEMVFLDIASRLDLRKVRGLEFSFVFFEPAEMFTQEEIAVIRGRVR